MNKKGFTLIEILAVIVIIGIISAIGIAAVSQNIENSRKSAFINLARNYAESARAMRAEDRLPYEPKKNEAVLLPVEFLDGTQIENNEDFPTPYGNLILSSSYVVVTYEKIDGKPKTYNYYVTLLDDTLHGIDMVNSNELDEENIINDNSRIIKDYNSFTSSTTLNLGENTYQISETIRSGENGPIKYIIFTK